MSNYLTTPIIFFDNKAIQSEDLGTIYQLPIQKMFQYKTANNKFYTNEDIIINNNIINNICDLCNTFMIKLLEDNIDKAEIAYILDFTDRFDMKTYIKSSFENMGIIKNNLDGQLDTRVFSNLILSDIIFILNQFIQFYVMTKLVYTSEGIDLYKYLYKETYGEDAPDTKVQDQYVFCVAILGSMLELEVNNIMDCITKLHNMIQRINHNVLDLIN